MYHKQKTNKKLIMNILPVLFLLLLTLHFKITDIQCYGFCCGTVWCCFKVYVFQIICVLPLRSMANIWFFLNFDNYCMGPSVRQLIAMMVPSVCELISHIYFVLCIKYVYDWKIKYLSISICVPYIFAFISACVRNREDTILTGGA